MGKILVNHRLRSRCALPVGSAKQTQTYPLGVAVAVLISVILAGWAYWPIIAGLSRTLRTSPDYSGGQVIPLMALVLVWRERKSLRQCEFAPCWWGGSILLLLAGTAGIYGSLSMRLSIERYALVLAVAGLVLTLAGRQVFHRVLWILLFLFLMAPLPNMIHSRISPPLQRLATTGSVFLLEAVGAPVSREGNVVILDSSTRLAVAEACNGLRMLTAFVIVAAFIAYVVKRPRWHKGILLASSIPIAVLCNMLRIFATAMLMLCVSAELGQKFFHDFSGYVMMLATVWLLFGEVWLIDRIIMPEPESQQKREKAEGKPATGSRAAPSPETLRIVRRHGSVPQASTVKL